MIREEPNADVSGAEESWHRRIAAQIHEARTAAGLTRRQLAERMGTRQSVIANLEDPNYRGHSLAMLERIAKSLGQRLCVQLSGFEEADPENIAAAQWLRTCAPSNEEMLKWAETAEIPPETNEDTDDEPPW